MSLAIFNYLAHLDSERFAEELLGELTPAQERMLKEKREALFNELSEEERQRAQECK